MLITRGNGQDQIKAIESHSFIVFFRVYQEAVANRRRRRLQSIFLNQPSNYIKQDSIRNGNRQIFSLGIFS